MNNKGFDPYEVINSINFEEIKKHPNILIAARFWEDERYNAAKVCYKFMRKIDDLIDDRKAENPVLSECEKVLYTDKINEWIECLGLIEDTNSEFAEVAKTVRDFQLPMQLFNNFAKSMLHDINHSGFECYNQFVNYSEGASVAPASIFVHLCCLNILNKPYAVPAMDVVLAARPCAMFSYIVHIIRDFQVDQFNNLNYFANDILEQHNLASEDLRQIAETEIIIDEFRNLIRFYMQKAEEYRIETEKTITRLAPYLDSRYLLSLEIIYHLYNQVYKRIDVENGTFTTEELNPTPGEIKVMVENIIERVCVAA